MQFHSFLRLGLWTISTWIYSSAPVHAKSCLSPTHLSNSANSLPNLCTFGFTALSTEIDSDFAQSHYLAHSGLELDIFFLPALSTHFQGYWQSNLAIQSNRSIARTTQIREAYARLGTMGLNRFSLEAGKIRTLFGVEADWSLPYIDERKNVLRTTPSGNGARVVVDNLRSFLMEISLLKCDPPTHEGKLPAPETTGIATESSERSLATLRLMTDSGSETLNRLFASAMSDNYHRHRYGLGILSVQPNGTQTIVEWIRQQQTPHFEQIWEIEYWQPHSRPLATHAKFSGHHRISRTFSFGQVYFPSQFQDHLQTAMILFFHQDTTGQKKHRWRFVVELAAKI